MQIGDGVASWIRTAVPAGWAFLVTLLLEWWTGAPTEIAEALGSPVVIGAVVWVVLAVWYAFWRWLEPKLPTWLNILAFGLDKQPTYDGENTIPGEVIDDGGVAGGP